MSASSGAPLLLLAPAVAAGGAAGALGRYGLAVALPTPDGGVPVGTLLANLVGCLLLGLVAGRWGASPWLRPVLGTGVLGGFTTWSALAVETDRLLMQAPAVALAYLGVTTAGGLTLAWLGLAAGRRVAS